MRVWLLILWLNENMKFSLSWSRSVSYRRVWRSFSWFTSHSVVMKVLVTATQKCGIDWLNGLPGEFAVTKNNRSDCVEVLCDTYRLWKFLLLNVFAETWIKSVYIYLRMYNFFTVYAAEKKIVTWETCKLLSHDVVIWINVLNDAM